MQAFCERNYPETRFGGFTDVDGTVVFFTRVNALLNAEMTVLDVGCGRGEYMEDPLDYRRNLRNLRGKVRRVVGIDVDPAGARNPAVDEFRRIDPARPWPVANSSVDLLLSDWVLEHIAEPARFMSECARVLKPGGFACFRTPNARGYVALISRLISHHYHARIVKLAQGDRKDEDVFPTVYRCNTPGKLRKLMRRHGLEGVVYGHESEPH